MDLLRWMGWMFARFVALSVTLVSGWVLVINLVERHHAGWVLAWILASGLVGVLGGVVYLLSLDGAVQTRTPAWRTGGRVGMLAAAVLPTSSSIMLVPLVLVLFPSLYSGYGPRERLTSG